MKLKQNNVVNDMETIQNNDIMSTTQANQTKKDVALQFKIVNILKLPMFYNRFVNVLHVLKTINKNQTN